MKNIHRKSSGLYIPSGGMIRRQVVLIFSLPVSIDNRVKIRIISDEAGKK